jgi:hypothetical protein
MKRLWVVATGQAPSEIQARHRRELTASLHRGAMIDPSSDWEMFELRRRNCAGLWAARVTLVLSVPFGIVAWAQGADNAWLTYMLLPVIAAYFAGAFFGSCIANPFEVSDEHLAGRRGVLVAICAYVIFALEVGTMSVSPLEAGLSAFMGAVLLSGWLALPAAFFAGVMGFRASQGGLRYSRASQG